MIQTESSGMRVMHKSKSTARTSGRIAAKLPIAAATLLKTGSLEQARQVVGISRQTFCRWRQRPEFARLMTDYKEEIFRAVSHELEEGAKPAAAMLVKLVNDDAAPMPSRVRAALSVLKFLERSRDKDAIETRVIQLESFVKQHVRRGVQ